MTTPDEVCQQLAEGLNDTIEFRLVDITCGRVLAQYPKPKSTPADDQHHNDAVTSLLHGLAELEPILIPISAPSDPDSRRELCVTTAKCHLLASTVVRGTAAIVLTTPRSTSLGMAWAHLKAAIPLLEETTTHHTHNQ